MNRICPKTPHETHCKHHDKASLITKAIPPTPARIRDELEALFLGEILGPAQGEREEIDQPEPIHHRYLVGKLAPRNDRISEALQDELAVAERSDGEEGVAEPTAPPSDSLFPSAMGLRFTLSGDATELRVSARWDWYKREKSEDVLTEAGNPKTIWRRYPMAGAVSVGVKAGVIEPSEVSEEQPDVVVRGRLRRDGNSLLRILSSADARHLC